MLCRLIWPAMSDETYSDDHYHTLAAHVRYEISRAEKALASFRASDNEERKMTTVLAHVRSSAHKPMYEGIDDIRLQISGGGNMDEQALEIMRLAASLVSMTYLRTAETRIPSEMRVALWRLDVSLSETLTTCFSTPHNTQLESLPIPPELTVSTLVANHGYNVNWTNCLKQHLDIDRESRVISVFPHKIWLSAHTRSSDQCVMPAAIIGEALDTLDLLFPHGNAPTESFLEKQGQRFHKLALCIRGRKSNLSDYPHWGKKIEDLMGILHEPPVGFQQFLPRWDRPNLLESANFWIAVFVAGLAVISFVFGLIAVIYAKESLDISKKSLRLTDLQYQLSLAQACSDPESAPLLPDWCRQEQ
ncbi:hypothetical protein CPLU01_12120 [Colletotrichum plurivorum]|uniref:Uncharacterized protein n=1 Tax=Colletotrichum plurivorum TaxID=2175906 RepID=A0A8H6N7G2_9PEZI|nr:hypothetical protein CPLU01_12120 [Colletotrichum plurivorum]